MDKCINLTLMLLAFVTLNTLTVHSAQILGIFAHPGKSHFDFFRPLLHGLAAAGHNLTVVSYFPNKVPITNYTDVEITGMPLLTDFINLQVFENSFELIPYKMPSFFMLHAWGMQACEAAFNSDAIKNLLKSPQKYDVIILEQFNNDCMMAVAHLLNAPIIALGSCAIMAWHYQRMGSPFATSFQPMNFLPYNDEMNFVARLNNFMHFHASNLLYNIYTQKETNALIRKHLGPGIPPIEELVKQTSLMLINQHFSLTGTYPYPPNIIEVGGLHIPAEKPLETRLKTLLDNSASGVIFISWGSMVRPETLPPQKRQALLRVIQQLPEYTFLMKWSNDTMPNKPKNLHTFNWMPQRDILCHPNLKAFIGHGGLLGSSEAAYCGVPMLITPFYGDQFLNAAILQKRKLGLIVEYKDFTENRILEALKFILKPSFANDVKLLSEAYKNRLQKPLDESIFWVEYVIQTKGAPLLQSTANQLNWFILNSFDVYLFLILLFLVICTITCIIFKFCLTLFKHIKKHKTKTQ